MRVLLEDLERRGLVEADNKGQFHYVRARNSETGARADKGPANRLTGKLSVNRRGMGFVSVEGLDEEIVVAPRFMKTALHGDIVAVAPFARPLRGRRRGEGERTEGEIVEIVKRTITTVVGTLDANARFWFVIPDDQRLSRDIYVSRDDAAAAKSGDKVLVELLPWDDEHKNPEGTIVEVLGRSGDARVEVLAVARSFGLPMHFPKEVEEESRRLTGDISSEEIRTRVDLRRQTCITIDPEDAKDFDDALSIEELRDGAVRLGVHIADVSHYVREGTLLDAEAYQRGTSVYMVNEVIPMLPERLSNDLCSLRPDVDRLTYSVFMDVNAQGKVTDYSIAKSVIHSARRFTYEEVQSIIEKKHGEHVDVLLRLFALSQILLKRRRRNGSIDFDTAEAKFKFDETGLPSHIVKKVRLDAHRLVEECMLLANKTVAKHVGQEKADERTKPFAYRVHDAPDPSRLADLANFVKQFGYSLDDKKGVSSRALQKLLDQVRGSAVEDLITEVTLRSMAKAIYSERNIGHYGLGFKYYAHFTSPIRRYPDLVVHRLLHEYTRPLTPERRAQLEASLPPTCRQASERERVAVEAERASVKVMQAEYMKRHVGDEFAGIIGGVTEFGLFVEITDLLVEGLVKVRDLGDDYYLFDEKKYTLRGRSRGKQYRLGDKIRVKVVAVDPEKREIDFAIVK